MIEDSALDAYLEKCISEFVGKLRNFKIQNSIDHSNSNKSKEIQENVEKLNE